MERLRWYLLLAGLAMAAIAGVIVYLVLPFPREAGDTSGSAATDAPSTIAANPIGSPAPRIQGISSWINSEPHQITDFRGKVVLIDFWTYTCVNCIRTFPYLKEWHRKYSDRGLVILGIHTPEFEFEKKRENVVEAAKQHGLTYAMAQDNDYQTWDAFRNRYWPAKYLIDKDGVIRYVHFGEGAYQEAELKIRELLQGAGFNVGDIPVEPAEEPKPDPAALSGQPETGMTREIYAGFERNSSLFGGYVGNREYYQGPKMEIFYNDPGDRQNQFIYLHGLWINNLESLRHGRETQNLEDYIALKFYATSVNAVISPEGNVPFKVLVTLDAKPLDQAVKGADVAYDETGNSFVVVNEPKMYRLVEGAKFAGHEMRLSSNSPAFALFAFTFGAYNQGP